MSVRDGERHLHRALDSILHQTFEDFEVLVVDDGSVDGTAAILRGCDDRRLRVLEQPNRGLVAALNRGVEEARGALIARMDADDISDPDRLSQQVELLNADPTVAMVGCTFEFIDDEGRRVDLKLCYPHDDEIRRFLPLRNEFAHGSVTMRRAAVLAAGGYTDTYPWAEDLDLWLRLASAGRLANLPDPLYSWRLNKEGLSSLNADAQGRSAARLRTDIWPRLKPKVRSALEMLSASERLGRLPMGSAYQDRYLEDEIAVVLARFTRRELVSASRELYGFLSMCEENADRFVARVRLNRRLGRAERSDAVVEEVRPTIPPVRDDELGAVYTDDFLLSMSVGARRSAEAVVPLLVERLTPSSVIDLGCGVGTWLSVFKTHGVNDLLGIDGPHVDPRALQVDPSEFVPHDLTTPLQLGRRFDLALSLEVAEHLSPEGGENLVSLLAGASDVIVFSAAIPRQGGEHHVNEQWPSYWVERFATRGFTPSDFLRQDLWEMDDVECWYSQNMLVFLNARGRATHPDLPGPSHVMRLVHPRLYALATEERDRAREHDASTVEQIELMQAEGAGAYGPRALVAALPGSVFRAVGRRLGRRRRDSRGHAPPPP